MKTIDTLSPPAPANLWPQNMDGPPGGIGHPVSIVTVHQSLARKVREYLDRRGLVDWEIHQSYYSVFDDDLIKLANEISPLARWEQPDEFVGGLTISKIIHARSIFDGTEAPWKKDDFGILMIPEARVLIARAHYVDLSGDHVMATFVASPSLAAIHEFQRKTTQMSWRKRRENRRWSVCYGANNQDEGTLIDAGPGFEQLDVSDALMATISRELIGFFHENVRRLHKNLRLPYSRRSLLYGPPGTGKTSICRAVARACTGVAAFHLVPGSDFDEEDLKYIFDEFCASAPGILLIEDLDTLVGERGIKVSNLLNMLDGANSPQGAGLLILATTNYPERLPPSLANRPGRFVPLEVPLPDGGLRNRFLTRSFPDLAGDVIESIVRRTDGLSFAHLNELLLVAGLMALNEGREQRIRKDIDLALDHILRASDDATTGFIPKPSGKFGFAAIGSDQSGSGKSSVLKSSHIA